MILTLQPMPFSSDPNETIFLTTVSLQPKVYNLPRQAIWRAAVCTSSRITANPSVPLHARALLPKASEHMHMPNYVCPTSRLWVARLICCMHVALSSHPRDCTLGHNLTVSGRTCVDRCLRSAASCERKSATLLSRMPSRGSPTLALRPRTRTLA